MKVHFIASRTSLEKDIESLRHILKAVRATGHEVTDEWLENAYELLVLSKGTREDWYAIFKKRQEAIAQSDVVIAETSHENFGVGYQVALAVNQKKPVLLLHHKSADKNAFATGVVDDWVKHEEYDEKTLNSIVQKFLDDNDIKSKDMRFNFFIDRKIYNYLRWSALKTGKTKAEILRDLVEKEIDRESA